MTDQYNNNNKPRLILYENVASSGSMAKEPRRERKFCD